MNTPIRNQKKISVLKSMAVIAAFSLAACASAPPVEPISSTADPAQEIAVTEESLAEARNQQVDVFSPKSYSKAENSLKDAQEARAKGKPNDKILKDVAISRAWLEQAKQKAQVSKTASGNLEQARTYAVQAGAPKTHSKEFKKADKAMMSFTEDLEDGSIRNAEKKSAELQERYRKLEVESVQTSLLTPARDNLKAAKEEGAKKSAPKSFAAAEKRLEAAEAAIETDPRNMAENRQLADIATRESEFALMINRRVAQAEDRSTEDLILRDEMQRRQISSLSERAAAEGALLAASAATIEEQREMQAKIEAVRSNFSPQEADVLQDGDKLLIRLKGLNFKSGQSTIEPQHYGLLQKVEASLKELDPASVVVEGHTDATGSAKVNKSLSQKRATAVEKYLSANDAVDEAKMQAVGVGFAKPIAPNNTAKDRALNRRIDLVITTR